MELRCRNLHIADIGKKKKKIMDERPRLTLREVLKETAKHQKDYRL